MKIKIVSPMLREQDIKYATPGSCAIDLRACIDEPIRIEPGDVAMIPSGIALDMSGEVNEDNEGSFSMGAIILPRSGLGAKHGIVLGNLVGLIDNDYQGEIMITPWNRGGNAFAINPLDRIAQMAFVPFVKPEIEFVNEFDTETERGANGFGSTGV